MYECNDGGVYYTADSGNTWVDVTNGIGHSQMYTLSVSQLTSDYVACGLQDNGGKLKNGNWSNIVGGDGMQTVIDYTNDGIIYAAIQNGHVYKITNGSQSTIVENNGSGIDDSGAWVTPFQMHPTNNNTLVLGKRSNV